MKKKSFLTQIFTVGIVSLSIMFSVAARAANTLNDSADLIGKIKSNISKLQEKKCEKYKNLISKYKEAISNAKNEQEDLISEYKDYHNKIARLHADVVKISVDLTLDLNKAKMECGE